MARQKQQHKDSKYHNRSDICLVYSPTECGRNASAIIILCDTGYGCQSTTTREIGTSLKAMLAFFHQYQSVCLKGFSFMLIMLHFKYLIH